MKNIYQKFDSFKNRNRLSNEMIAKIATEYANSPLEHAKTYFSEKDGISESVFYKARDYAIVFCLVDHNMYERIRKKSSTNYKSNNTKNSAVASMAHFDELIVQRQEILNGFSKNEILDIGYKYVEGITIRKIAISYNIGEYAIEYLIRKGIVHLIFDFDIVKQISATTLNLKGSLQKRQENKKILLDCIQKEISFLDSQIKCYNLYFRNEVEEVPSLLSLKKRREDRIKMYNETLQL